MRFTIERDEALISFAEEPLRSMYQLSPFVWRDGADYAAIIRGVPKADDPKKKIAQIYYGRSADGLRFTFDANPVVAVGEPGSADDGGCEDPTVVRNDKTTSSHEDRVGNRTAAP